MTNQWLTLFVVTNQWSVAEPYRSVGLEEILVGKGGLVGGVYHHIILSSCHPVIYTTRHLV